MAWFIKGDRRGEQPFPAQIGVAAGEVEIARAASLDSGNNLRIGAEVVAVGQDADSPADQEIGRYWHGLGLAILAKRSPGDRQRARIVMRRSEEQSDGIKPVVAHEPPAGFAPKDCCIREA
jgi:hypothetical protein